jgi:uncharacterized protein YutE (UPF0331/DUF86 family)
LVDVDRVEARIQRLEEMIERLEEVRAEGEEAYLARPPSDYADVFKVLGEKEIIAGDLALRLGDAARQRNLLVHLYMEIDDRAVFASLGYLDDLRAFATAVEGLAQRPE